MADNDNRKEWLALNGGPSVLLHIERDKKSGKASEKKLVSKLLKIEEVQSLLSYMDQFAAQPRGKKELEHLLHYFKDVCVDQFFPRLMDLGFRAGIDIFDQKMEEFRKLYSYLLREKSGYTIMISRYFFIAGYMYKEVLEAVRRRINLLYPAAKERIFNIYQDKSKLPKTPKNWENKGIIKDDLNPWLNIKPLPVFYDIAAMAYCPAQYLDPDTLTKIDTIITYILEPQFQKLPEGYGLVWTKSIRRYHACGWSPTLPLYRDYLRPGKYDDYSLLYYVNLVSYFLVARKSEWFLSCLKTLEKYQAEDGTFLFPKELLNRKYIPEAFLNESNLELTRNKRNELIRRIAGTLFMYKLYKRIDEKRLNVE